MAIISSISGLRATLSDDSLNQSLIHNYAKAFHKFLQDGTLVIGRDGRPSGKWIEKVLTATFTKLGRKYIAIGVVPSPTVQLITQIMNAVGGISITASHNPDDWNGLKFINSRGIFLDEDENIKLQNILSAIQHKDNSSWVQSNSDFNETNEANKNALTSHIDNILQLHYITDFNIINKLAEINLTAVIDAVNSSGSAIIPNLLDKMNVNYKKLYCDGTGIFPHLPEPLPQNLQELSNTVKETKADLGIAVDPDADRLVLIDENGIPIGEENTIVLAIYSLLSSIDNAKEAKIVVNHSTTMGVEFIANKFGAKVFRSPVGEINVVKKMIEVGAIIGGEGSGGVILPASHYGRDSLVGISLILSLIARSGKTLSQLRKEIPNYFLKKIKIDFNGDLNKKIGLIQNYYTNQEIVLEDGIKINFSDFWIQIRKSNTEPIVRVICESINSDKSEKELEKILNLIQI
jgi:phosphomannomutase